MAQVVPTKQPKPISNINEKKQKEEVGFPSKKKKIEDEVGSLKKIKREKMEVVF
jgi:hypothetical protein